METQNRTIVTLAQLAEDFPGVELGDLRKSVRRHGALIKEGPIEFGDRDLFFERVKAAAEKARLDATKPKRDIGSTNSIGLLRAFLKKSPGIVEKRKAAIVATENQVKAAQNNYERRRSSKELKKLKDGLAEHLNKVEAAKRRLDQLLNQEDEPSTSDE